MYADDLVLCGESEEDQRARVGRFVEVCRKRGLKFNSGKSKVPLEAGTVRSLVNGRDLQVERGRVLQETFPVLTYDSEIML